MPRSSGVYSPPPGTGGTPQTPISSSMFNAYVADMTTDANNPRPIVAGGTGAATASDAVDNLVTSGTAQKLLDNTFGSARTVIDERFVLVDPSDATKQVRLDAGNVTAGQTRVLTMPDHDVDLGTMVGKGSNVASASTVTLGAGTFFHITGTTTITDIDFTTAYDGRWAVLEFDGALTLTHNATTLNIPGGASIVTAAGDRAFIVQDSGDNIHVMLYQRAALRPDRITIGTVAATTSGTVVDYTGVPAGAKRISILLNGVSTNGTSVLMVQIGDSGGYATSGYAGFNGLAVNAGATVVGSIASGFQFGGANASNVYYGRIVLELENPSSNVWIASGVVGVPNVLAAAIGGTKTLSGVLDRLRLTTIGGTDSFDAGDINISIEF